MNREDLLKKYKKAEYYLQINILESWFKIKKYFLN